MWGDFVFRRKLWVKNYISPRLELGGFLMPAPCSIGCSQPQEYWERDLIRIRLWSGPQFFNFVVTKTIHPHHFHAISNLTGRRWVKVEKGFCSFELSAARDWNSVRTRRIRGMILEIFHTGNGAPRIKRVREEKRKFPYLYSLPTRK